ncbi:MAG: hypothetical protein ABSG80_16550 [Verrucomicrobiota bacterium]|jgi:hypothetical protein
MPDGAGTAGADGEPDDGAEQQLILPPQWQQARTGCREHDDTVGTGRNGVPTSNTLQTMASAIFIS